jgi:hypothetical protein
MNTIAERRILLVDSDSPNALRRLIVTPPPAKSGPGWGKIIPVLQEHLPAPSSSAYDTYITLISPGLPFHLPFSFSPVQAEALSAALAKVGCQVRIVPE